MKVKVKDFVDSWDSIILKAIDILNDHPEYLDIPASISGKHHHGETQFEHIKQTVTVIQHLCDEFDVRGTNRSIVIAAGLLHDIGLVTITVKGDVDLPGWKYNKATGYSRQKESWFLHPLFSALIVEKYDWEIDYYDYKEILKKLVSSHMSHWYKVCPQPEGKLAYILCAADYIAGYGVGIFEYKKRKD